jgi:hypothetical protein
VVKPDKLILMNFDIFKNLATEKISELQTEISQRTIFIIVACPRSQAGGKINKNEFIANNSGEFSHLNRLYLLMGI